MEVCHGPVRVRRLANSAGGDSDQDKADLAQARGTALPAANRAWSRSDTAAAPRDEIVRPMLAPVMIIPGSSAPAWSIAVLVREARTAAPVAKTSVPVTATARGLQCSMARPISGASSAAMIAPRISAAPASMM